MSASAPALRLPWLRSGVVISLGAVLAAILVGVALITLIGVSIADARDAFIDGTLGSAYAIGASVNRSVVFALVGLGFIFANRANLTNVGGEGQIAMGGIAATAVALYGHVDTLPGGLAFILPMLAASLAGALWGGLAGVLKARAGTNEVIATLLLSFIAVWILYWCVQSTDLLRQPMTNSATLPESLTIPDSTQLPLVTGDPALPLNIGLPLCGVIALVVTIVLTRSTVGIRLTAPALPPTGIWSCRCSWRVGSAAWRGQSCCKGTRTCSRTGSPRAMVSTAWWSACWHAGRSPASSPVRCCSGFCARAGFRWRSRPVCPPRWCRSFRASSSSHWPALSSGSSAGATGDDQRGNCGGVHRLLDPAGHAADAGGDRRTGQ
jgi:ribose/xylose/arabinose/galactoside ABC-type transport system permease subunit